ncbi:hypothetical protein RI367_003306 [Sorochytrium milnesiophthora]
MAALEQQQQQLLSSSSLSLDAQNSQLWELVDRQRRMIFVLKDAMQARDQEAALWRLLFARAMYLRPQGVDVRSQQELDLERDITEALATWAQNYLPLPLEASRLSMLPVTVTSLLHALFLVLVNNWRQDWFASVAEAFTMDAEALHSVVSAATGHPVPRIELGQGQAAAPRTTSPPVAAATASSSPPARSSSASPAPTSQPSGPPALPVLPTLKPVQRSGSTGSNAVSSAPAQQHLQSSTGRPRAGSAPLSPTSAAFDTPATVQQEPTARHPPPRKVSKRMSFAAAAAPPQPPLPLPVVTQELPPTTIATTPTALTNASAAAQRQPAAAALRPISDDSQYSLPFLDSSVIGFDPSFLSEFVGEDSQGLLSPQSMGSLSRSPEEPGSRYSYLAYYDNDDNATSPNGQSASPRASDAANMSPVVANAGRSRESADLALATITAEMHVDPKRRSAIATPPAPAIVQSTLALVNGIAVPADKAYTVGRIRPSSVLDARYQSPRRRVQFNQKTLIHQTDAIEEWSESEDEGPEDHYVPRNAPLAEDDARVDAGGDQDDNSSGDSDTQAPQRMQQQQQQQQQGQGPPSFPVRGQQSKGSRQSLIGAGGANDDRLPPPRQHSRISARDSIFLRKTYQPPPQQIVNQQRMSMLSNDRSPIVRVGSPASINSDVPSILSINSQMSSYANTTGGAAPSKARMGSGGPNQQQPSSPLSPQASGLPPPRGGPYPNGNNGNNGSNGMPPSRDRQRPPQLPNRTASSFRDSDGAPSSPSLLNSATSNSYNRGLLNNNSGSSSPQPSPRGPPPPPLTAPAPAAPQLDETLLRLIAQGDQAALKAHVEKLDPAQVASLQQFFKERMNFASSLP